MATVRRSKAMPTDGPTAKFLYTIIKQLDLKSVSHRPFFLLHSQEVLWTAANNAPPQIDWNLVASQLEISNGHAARMRYSRFRQQMEGITSTPRSSRPKKTAAKTGKGTTSKADLLKDRGSSQPLVKQENAGPAYESNPYIKVDPYGHEVQNLAEIPHVCTQVMHPQPVQPHMVPYTSLTAAPGTLTMYAPVPAFPPSPPVALHQQAGPSTWAPIKTEPEPEPKPEAGGKMHEASVKVEPPQEKQ
ncbi:hypothetical protein IFM61606_02844 [Aspergillus udagawae]|uniref:Myb-like DNA-binding domain-containing protein n=1 Tax=Aspergillus udagawae TaxID=91492 RepID=A0ABQ1BD63_9EURO|nr:hypothetical protein IFM51744_02731 [Aspergillus udagawae]GFF98959.1 hypothetical protein IFM53868_10057 [Aspergillus udagawae]GFG01060.1 hypothetical protein IFM5058_00281 [Aspergillus udagawae]GFG22973.1 hypothetical protein IFM61606_02844 [Aspergillus udagawae]